MCERYTFGLFRITVSNLVATLIKSFIEASHYPH